ncbi:hypothetical protein ECC01_22015, partial [Bacillus tequilensis]|nr:hypothetical protein [Bacillus tequilensis]
MLMSVALEVAVQNAAGVRIAREIGAARVELTQALALGGLTPSRGMIELALEARGEQGPEVHVLIRPRAGDFRYERDELHLARALGMRRVLTSGGASRAADGLDVLRALVRESAGGIEVMAGSGITAVDVVTVAGTGVDAVHFSAKRTVAADGGVRLGSASDGVGG